MAKGSYELSFNTGELNALLRGPDGAVVQELRRRGNNVLTKAKILAPVDTGALRASIRLDVVSEGGDPVVKISSPLKYAIYQHEGTGIYAGKGYIYPKGGNFLVWKSRSTGKLIFARRVRGVPPRPFLKNALDAAAD